MKTETRRKMNRGVAAVALFCMATQTFAAQLTLTTVPLFIGANVPPKVMLTISKDQQLYKKAYNDYTDLDPEKKDGIETTYKHSIAYYGYFDPAKCYKYVSDRFEPETVNVVRDVSGNLIPTYCNGNQWSGNFLNWVSMTRMDAVRKLLYGGLRSTDTLRKPCSSAPICRRTRTRGRSGTTAPISTSSCLRR